MNLTILVKELSNKFPKLAIDLLCKSVVSFAVCKISLFKLKSNFIIKLSTKIVIFYVCFGKKKNQMS